MTATTAQAAASNDWESFASSVWERRPLYLECPLTDELPGAEELFDAVLRATAASSSGRLKNPGDVRLFFNHSLITRAFLPRYLPARGDGDFDGYTARLVAMGGTSFALTINSLQQFSRPLFDTLRRHMSALHQAVGALPAGGTDCHIIVGRYDEAPTRIHKDTAGVFTFVLEGTKRFYLWPFERFSELAGPNAMYGQINLRHLDYRDYLDDAIVLAGTAGDAFYWPASYWHCGKSDGASHVTLHVANYLYRDPTVSVGRLLMEVLGAAANEDGWISEVPLPALRSSTSLLPVPFATALDRFTDRAVHDQARGLLRATWLRRMTGGNFEVVPPPPAAVQPVTSADTVARMPCGQWMVVQVSSSAAELGTNGQVSRLPWRSWLTPLLDTLTAGDSHSVEGLTTMLRLQGHDVVSGELLAVVQELLRCGALTVRAAAEDRRE